MAMNFLSDSQVVNFRSLKIWAERGLIHVEGIVDGDYKSISVVETLERTRAINDMLKNSREEMKRNKQMCGHVYDEHMRAVEQMIEICQRAREQGTPDDESACRDLARRQPKSVVVGANYGSF